MRRSGSRTCWWNCSTSAGVVCHSSVPVEDQAIPTPNTLIAPKNSKVDSGQTGKSRRTCLEHFIVYRPSDIKHWPSLRKAHLGTPKNSSETARTMYHPLSNDHCPDH
uniref:Uncharacterized protein n=1 Tax=Vespula pensylvanica TaxID=30213 RepID=A0A834P6K4_VESPE|nr:hypothetical protein H0235_006316 [Vespula pensylvanica]